METLVDLRDLDIGNERELRRKEKVRAFTALPGVPEGTPGKVILVQGFDRWIRYRVLFDNGVDLGTIDRAYLAPAKEFDKLVAARQKALEEGAVATDDDAAAAEDGGGGGGGGEGTVVNGVTIPPYLLERSKAARERLGA